VNNALMATLMNLPFRIRTALLGLLFGCSFLACADEPLQPAEHGATATTHAVKKVVEKVSPSSAPDSH